MSDKPAKFLLLGGEEALPRKYRYGDTEKGRIFVVKENRVFYWRSEK